MNFMSRTITGMALIIVGLLLSSLPLFFSAEGSFVTLIYGIPLFIIGIFILVNKNEDKIERRKDE
ncbi:MAG: hypothetical protein PVJ67_02650 [Candidatus Pacearchaeota archaeon]|jgi:membrane-bound ClpP family serine protease